MIKRYEYLPVLLFHFWRYAASSKNPRPRYHSLHSLDSNRMKHHNRLKIPFSSQWKASFIMLWIEILYHCKALTVRRIDKTSKIGTIMAASLSTDVGRKKRKINISKALNETISMSANYTNVQNWWYKTKLRCGLQPLALKSQFWEETRW